MSAWRAAMMMAAGVVLLAGCGDPKAAIAEADAAGGEALDKYSRNISETVDLAASPDLVQRFCKNAMGGPCPEDITEKLAAAGYKGGTGVDLAQAFVVMVADSKDGEADLTSSDEDYLWAAYHVVVARDPDAGGAVDNLDFIKETGNRKTVLRSMLESQEFKQQQ